MIDLRKAQKALARAEADLPYKKNMRERASVEPMLMKLRKLVAFYQLAVQERQQLDNRQLVLQSGIEFAAMEERWSRHHNPLCRMHEARVVPSPSEEVSFRRLPHPDDWDRQWIQRIKLLTPLGENIYNDSRRAYGAAARLKCPYGITNALLPSSP